MAAAIAASRLIAWQGRAWRGHGRGYPAADPGGSRKYSGRNHQAQDLFPPDEVWAALYLALGRDIALGEMVRHTSGARLNELRFTEFPSDYLRVNSTAVSKDGQQARCSFPPFETQLRDAPQGEVMLASYNVC